MMTHCPYCNGRPNTGGFDHELGCRMRSENSVNVTVSMQNLRFTMLDAMKSLQDENAELVALLREWIATTHITPVTQYSQDLRRRIEEKLREYGGG